jgi:hypothetical protein
MMIIAVFMVFTNSLHCLFCLNAVAHLVMRRLYTFNRRGERGSNTYGRKERALARTASNAIFSR